MKSFAVENLTCERGGREIFTGVSANGAGKSSLLRLCAGLARPAAGQVLADDEECPPEGRARKPGLSALENLRTLSALAGAAVR
ncbi:MAG: ABC transporter ATP-binding protein [Rhodospirillales bacterium]